MATTLTESTVSYEQIAPFLLALEKRLAKGTEKILATLPPKAKGTLGAALISLETIDGERTLTAFRYHFLCEEDGLKTAYITYQNYKVAADRAEAERREYARIAKLPVKKKPVLR